MKPHRGNTRNEFNLICMGWSLYDRIQLKLSPVRAATQAAKLRIVAGAQPASLSPVCT